MAKRTGSLENGHPPFNTLLRHDAKLNSFLDDVCLQHGPVRDTGRFLLAADGAFRTHGITLHLTPVAEVTASLTSPTASELETPAAKSSFALIGRTGDVRIVATVVVHIYAPGSAPTKAPELGTWAGLSGLWLAPEYRGLKLGRLLHRVGCGLALGTWNIDTALQVTPAGDYLNRLTRAEIIAGLNAARQDLMAAFNATHGLPPAKNGAFLH